MSKPLKTENFIEKCKLIYKDKYDYSKVCYINNHTKVCLACKTHGEFWKTPQLLLKGYGCPKCGKIHKMSKEEFIERANKMHNNVYDYSKVEYVNYDTKVCIICQNHGEFWQSPHHHLSGHGCPKCANEKNADERNCTLNGFVEKAKLVHGNKYDYSKSEYINAKSKIKIICPKHGIFYQVAHDHIFGHGCPKCKSINSGPEEEIAKFIANLIGEWQVIRNDRTILNGLELDVYIPNLKLAIEYNGLHWHTEIFGKGKNYHLSKTVEAKNKGISLIQIFEDEWLEHKNIVLEKLKHFIGKSQCKVIGARKCEIKEVSKDDAMPFLTNYHIQGYVPSTLYIGAYYNNELVGVMSFLKERDSMWNLTRFVTNTNFSFPGLANRLFNFFIKSHQNSITEVKSFLDRRWAFGESNVYDKMGFKLVEVEKPDYRYVVGYKRMHKFGFRKQILHKKYGLPLSMTEKQMCDSLGFYRIWDCGLYKYVWHNKQLT